VSREKLMLIRILPPNVLTVRQGSTAALNPRNAKSALLASMMLIRTLRHRALTAHWASIRRHYPRHAQIAQLEESMKIAIPVLHAFGVQMDRMRPRGRLLARNVLPERLIMMMIQRQSVRTVQLASTQQLLLSRALIASKGQLMKILILLHHAPFARSGNSVQQPQHPVRCVQPEKRTWTRILQRLVTIAGQDSIHRRVAQFVCPVRQEPLTTTATQAPNASRALSLTME
jgi:hypothetical protein